MDARLPSINYALLAAARDELKRADSALRDAAQRAVSSEDTIELSFASAYAATAEESLFDFLNVMDSHCDAAGAADALDRRAAA